MKKLFTLIELIVVIVILGVLAAIVIPNIADQQEQAIHAEIVSNTRNLQTVTDMYMLKNNGEFPAKSNPTVGNPKKIDLKELYPDYIRDEKFKHGYYWIDYQGTVWGSSVDAPQDLTYKGNMVSFKSVLDAMDYEVFGYSYPKKVTSATKSGVYQIRSLEKVVLEQPIKVISRKLPVEKESDMYLVSAIDKFGLPTAPVGKQYDGYDSIFPTSTDFTLVTNANGKAIWEGIYTLEDKPVGTDIKYSFSTSNDGKTYSEPFVTDMSTLPNSQYLKVKVEMIGKDGKFPTLYKLKVKFRLIGEEYVEVDLINDLENSENTKTQLGDIILEDNQNTGKTEHIVQLPSSSYIEDAFIIGEVPIQGSITTKYQSSTDGVNWSETVLYPEELPQGNYVKVVTELERNNGTILSPTVEKIILKLSDNNPNTNPSYGGGNQTSPSGESPIDDWEKITSFTIVEDATQQGDWIAVHVTEDKPADTRILYRYFTSDDNNTWVGPFAKVEEAPNSRYFKVEVEYQHKKGTSNAPKVKEMSIEYKLQDGTTKNVSKIKEPIVGSPVVDFDSLYPMKYTPPTNLTLLAGGSNAQFKAIWSANGDTLAYGDHGIRYPRGAYRVKDVKAGTILRDSPYSSTYNWGTDSMSYDGKYTAANIQQSSSPYNQDIAVLDTTTGNQIFSRATNKLEAMANVSGNGKYVVWIEESTSGVSDYKVYRANLTASDINSTVERVSSKDTKQEVPIISGDGNVVLWVEANSNGNYVLYAKNMTTNVETKISLDTAYVDYESVHLSYDGNIIVWGDNRSGNYDVYVKNLSTGKEEIVANTPAYEGYAHLSGNGDIVVWTDYTLSKPDIYALNLRTGEKVAIANNPNWFESRARISPNGKLVAVEVNTVNTDFANTDLYYRGIQHLFTK